MSSSSSSLMGDYIGMESCANLDYSVDGEYNEGERGWTAGHSHCRRRRHQRWEMKKIREFPPPIPSLARTENLPSHMPWVMKRYYTSDGRLIIREEKVRHHEYFRAHRANGRLTLHLVPLDDDVLPPPPVVEDEEEEEEEDLINDYSGADGRGMDVYGEAGSVHHDGEGSVDPVKNVDDGNDGGKRTANNDRTVADELSMKLEASMTVISTETGSSTGVGGGGAGKCCECNSMGSGPGIFGMQVFALRPVHS